MLETILNAVLIPVAIKAFQFFWARVEASKYRERINDVRRIVKCIEQTDSGGKIFGKGRKKLDHAVDKLAREYKWARKIDIKKLTDMIESEVFNVKKGQ